MAIIRWRNDVWRPAEELRRLQNEINDLFDLPEVFPGRGIFDRSTSPALDMLETDEGYTIYCDLPGMDKKSLELSVTSNVLTIKGERKPRQLGRDAKVFRNETWEGVFQRTLAVPSAVDNEKIEAELKDGVLKIFLPRREEDKPKQIELKVR
ncbi:MAG: Hsp20/alpha crystallin family protein [Spirochaetales bacterium]|nr:Hsp20/alpha crystallin family protein [Spirochaetales bacterium]